MTSNLIDPLEIARQSNKSLVLSSQQMGWNGILVEQYQSVLTPSEIELPAWSAHLLNLHLDQPVQLTQKRDDRVYESTVQKGEILFVPAGQPSYWRCQGSATAEPLLHIHLQPEAIAQIAETAELDRDRIDELRVVLHAFDASR